MGGGYVIRRRSLTWFVESEDGTEVVSSHDTRQGADEALAKMAVPTKFDAESEPDAGSVGQVAS